jgi:zinc transport system permease protein
MVFTTIGLWLSYRFNLTSGATIILVAGAVYLASITIQPLLSRWRRDIDSSNTGTASVGGGLCLMEL